jgi:cell volume regulation protein A
MSDIQPFAWLVLLVAGVGLVAVLSSHLTERLKIPTPALFLAGAAIAVRVIPDLHAPPELTVQRLVTVALLVILFDGGMHIGWRRFSAARGPIVLVGVLGTFLTVAATATLVQAALGLGWYLSCLADERYPVAAGSSWKASPARTTRSESP